MKLARLVDPEDPRAPAKETWDALSAEERAWVIEQLPSEEAGFLPPEGDPHDDAVTSSKSALRAFYKRTGRKAYVGSDMNVFYPAERRFAPDCFVVLDAEPHSRESWVVLAEGKSLDFALEITSRGDHRKDAIRNVDWFAKLGIPEYFVFDLPRQRLLGYRLAPFVAGQEGTYVPIVPQQGRFQSQSLGLELAFETNRVRFYFGTAPLLDSEEVRETLERTVDAAVARAEHEAARAEQEVARAEQEVARADRALEATRRLVLDLCEVLGLELEDGQRATIEAAGVEELEALAHAIKRERRWPR